MPARNSDMLIGFATDKIFLIRFRTGLLRLSDNQNQPAGCSSQWKSPRQVSARPTSSRSHALGSTLRIGDETQGHSVCAEGDLLDEHCGSLRCAELSSSAAFP